MARKAGTLAVALTANSTAFERTMARAQGQLRSFGKAVKSTAMTLGVAFGASQLIGAFKSLNGEMDSIAKRSRLLNIDAERYQQFSYAARRTGTEIGTVEAGMKRLDMTLAKAVSGEKGAIDAFRALGLDLAEIRKLQPDQLFDLVAKSLNEITDPAEKSAAQLAIFGKNGAELNNFLRDYLKLGDEARSKGLIFKKEELKAAEALTDAFTDLGTSLKVLIANSGFTSWLNNVVKSIQEIARAMGVAQNIVVQKFGKEKNTANIPGTIPFSDEDARDILGDRLPARAGGRFTEQERLKNALDDNRLMMSRPDIDKLLIDGKKAIKEWWYGAVDDTLEGFLPTVGKSSSPSPQKILEENEARRKRLAEAAARAEARRKYLDERAAGKDIEKAVKTEKVKEAASEATGAFSVATLVRNLIGGNAPAERTADATEKLLEEARTQTLLQRQELEATADNVEMTYA